MSPPPTPVPQNCLNAGWGRIASGEIFVMPIGWTCPEKSVMLQHTPG